MTFLQDLTNVRYCTLTQPTTIAEERWSNLYDGDSSYESLYEIAGDRIVSLRSYKLDR